MFNGALLYDADCPLLLGYILLTLYFNYTLTKKILKA